MWLTYPTNWRSASTATLRATVLDLAQQSQEPPQDIIIEFLAATLASSSDDPAHVYGPALVQGIERHLLQAVVTA